MDTTDSTGADWKAGYSLAVDMLQEFDACDSEACSIEQTYRKGKPQHDIALSYLRAVLEKPEQLAGFSALLTDVLSAEIPLDASAYRRMFDQPAEAVPTPGAAKSRTDVDGASDLIRRAQSMVDVLFCLAVAKRHGAIDPQPNTMPDTLSMRLNLLTDAQQMLTGGAKSAANGGSDGGSHAQG